MPDNMSPENSSIDQFAKLGQPANLPGAEMGIVAQPTSQADLVGSKMPTLEKTDYGPEDSEINRFISPKEAPVNLLDDDSNKEIMERAAYERAMGGSEFDKGRVVENILARHPDPESVRYVLRDLQLSEENFNTNGEPDNRWEVSHRFRVITDRMMVLKMPVADLVEKKFIERLSDKELELLRSERGKSLPLLLNENYLAKSRHVEGFGFESYTVSVPVVDTFAYDDKGREIEQRWKKVPLPFVYLGPEKERAEKAEDFSKLRDEISARSLMMQMWGHHVTYYYALQKLAEGAYFGTTLSSEGLGVLFNLKGQEGAKTETVTGVKVNSLGEKIETAMRLYYVAALSEKPERFKKLMNTPGWKQFLFPRGISMSVIEDWIGQPDVWETEVQAGGNRTEKTLGEERKAGTRGRLTQKNIFAASDPYIESNLNMAIEEFIGGGGKASHVDKVEAETARRIANKKFRLFLLADQEGLELYKEAPKGNKMDPFDGLKIEFENAPGASDFGKLTHPDAYAGKSMRKVRDFMPEVGFLHSRKFYRRFMVDFLRHASAKKMINVKVDGVPSQIAEERSLMEQWWGYEGGFTKENVEYQEEKAVRLGDLPWSKYDETLSISKEEADMLGIPVGGYHHEAFKTLWLSGFMAGGEGRAHMIISATQHNPDNLMDDQWWQKFWKMLDVGIKKGVALEGEFRGVSDEEANSAVMDHKLGIVQGFVLGLHGLHAWGVWRLKEVEYYVEGSADKRSDSIAKLILMAARRGLNRAGVNFNTTERAKVLNGILDKV